MVGKRFSRWVVIKYAYTHKKYGRYFTCKCDCGVIKDVNGSSLRQKESMSCGHDKVQRLHAGARTHGMSYSSTYSTWRAILKRCYNPKATGYAQYGGRGIKVCDGWLTSFENFLSDMGVRPKNKSIDRIDNEKGYEPSNCRWATRSEQMYNRRPYDPWKNRRLK